jgi:hypothetical protein
MGRLIREWWRRTRAGHSPVIHCLVGAPAWITLEAGLRVVSPGLAFAAGLTPMPGCDSAAWSYDGSALWTGQETIGTQEAP